MLLFARHTVQQMTAASYEEFDVSSVESEDVLGFEAGAEVVVVIALSPTGTIEVGITRSYRRLAAWRRTTEWVLLPAGKRSPQLV